MNSRRDSPSRIRTISSLDLDALPEGEVSRLQVELAEDPLGRPVCVPVLVARGARPGPVFGLTAAIHGNELNGIPVIHRLFDKLDPAEMRGTVVAVVVANVPGFLARRRLFSERSDLNHIMPGLEGGNSARSWAYRLVDRVISRFDFLVDLHTASFGRVNSLYVRADMTHAMTSAIAYLQRPQIIVHNPPSDGTLRGTASELGIPAITLEIGNPQRFHRDFVKRSLVGLRAVLAEVEILPRRQVALGDPPVVCRRSFWTYTDRGGLLRVFPDVAQHIDAGAILARQRDIYGDVIREYVADEDVVVIGKSVDPVAETGARIAHLGVVADPHEIEIHERPVDLGRRKIQH